tara:strand:- start:196 stop:474 length:279 start_codon:yes stop_codon:yes gene_type:complete
MNKFANNVSVEEDLNFQAWLDAQEVADIQTMERELDERDMRCEEAEIEAEAIANVRRMAMEQGLSDDCDAWEPLDWEEIESDDGHRELYEDV